MTIVGTGSGAVLVVTRFIVPETQGPPFETDARRALESLAARPGYQRGELARAADDPTRWVLATSWADVGSWRRALGDYDVKLHATPLLARAIDEPSAFEVLFSDAPGAQAVRVSDRAEP